MRLMIYKKFEIAPQWHNPRTDRFATWPQCEMQGHEMLQCRLQRPITPSVLNHRSLESLGLIRMLRSLSITADLRLQAAIATN